MQKTRTQKLLSLILCMVLVAAMALFAIGCGDKKDTHAVNTTVYDDGAVLGSGAVQFTFTVVYKDGSEDSFTVNTDKTTVGEALTEHKIIAGEMGDFGLYVKEINGVVADHDVDQTYWAFYVDGEYSMIGVDTTNVVAGATYTYKVEK